MSPKYLRDEAYVKALMHQVEKDDVLGYIGKNLPLDIIYSFSLYAIPVQSDDRDILKFGDEHRKTCGGAYGTQIYIELDKCPLMHSSKIIILEDFCPVMSGGLKKFSKVNFYRDEKSLIKLIEENFGREYSEEKRMKASELLEEGRKLSDKLPFEYGFYSFFLENLEERNEFLKQSINK